MSRVYIFSTQAPASNRGIPDKIIKKTRMSGRDLSLISQTRLRNILLIIGVFNAIDCLITPIFLNLGFTEANPFMAPLVDTFWFYLVKLVFVPAGLCFVWHFRKHLTEVTGTAIFACALIYGGLMSYFAAVLFLVRPF